MKNLRKLLSAITVLGLTTVSAINVVACNNSSKPHHKKTDLNTIITDKNLDSIYIGQLNTPNEEQILKAIKTKNPGAKDLTTKDFTFKQGSSETTRATIIGQGQYQGEVTLNYISNNFKVIDKIHFSGDVYRMLSINNDILYIGLINWNKNGYILFKTVDGGKTFIPIKNVIGIQVNSIITDENKNLLVGTDNGLYKSTDGINFNKVLNNNVCSLTMDNKKNIWVGTSDGILFKGNIVESKFQGIKNFNKKIFSLFFLLGTKNMLYVGVTEGYSGNGELYTSVDEINFQKNFQINNEITSWTLSPNGTLWVGTYKSYGKGNLYKSTDGINFNIIKEVNNSVFSLLSDKENNIYIGIEMGIQKGKILKLIHGSKKLKQMTGIYTTSWCLSLNKCGDIYAGTGNTNKYISAIYKSEIFNI